MIEWRLEWYDVDRGRWVAQLSNDDAIEFTKSVVALREESAREGNWMDGATWRIARYKLELESIERLD